MKRLFRGGIVVSGARQRRADVLTEDEKILQVESRIEDADAEVTDITGKYLFPGFIDGHTHMDLEVAGTVTADGFDTGTKAEIAGGTTCIVDFATQNRGESLAFALARWHEKADGKASCDYAFHLALSDWNASVKKELVTVVSEGIRSFKLYTTYDGMAVDDQAIYEILACLKGLGGIAGVHCENKGIIDARLDALLAEKGARKKVSDYPGTRPALAEAEAVSRVLKIAACVDTPVVIVHLSSKEGCEEIRRARKAGQIVYAETCPQYLLMDEGKYGRTDARNYMIAPPLRKEEDQKVLWGERFRPLPPTTAVSRRCRKIWEQRTLPKRPAGCRGRRNVRRFCIISAWGRGRFLSSRCVRTFRRTRQGFISSTPGKA